MEMKNGRKGDRRNEKRIFYDGWTDVLRSNA